MKPTENRKKAQALIDPGSALLITANDTLPSNADGVVGFRQNNDLYWLTGINQEDCAVFLFPNHPNPSLREVLFTKHVDPDFVKWHGPRLTKDEARALSGINTVLWQHELPDFIRANAYLIENFLLQSTEHPRSENRVQTANDRLIATLKAQYPLHGFKRATPLLSQLRCIKSEAEIDRLREACRISGEGFKRLLKFIKPGVHQKHVEAELIHEYLQHGAAWSGYSPIVASGADTCILHYISNHKTCRDGELLLVDAAASFGLYNADLTRTIPVNGRFSERQRAVYNAVLRVHKALAGYVKPGLFFKEVQEHCNNLLAEEYLTLGLCTASQLKEKGRDAYIQLYGYHGFGHYLGLDVHDVGNIWEPIPENAVITIEPGIYIATESLGIRIENNYVVRSGGCENLMAGTPMEPEEIEQLMNSAR